MPDWTPELRRRLASLRLSPTREASIVDELSQHLEDRRRDLIAGGVDPDTATAMVGAELERAELLTPRLAALRQAQWHAAPPPGVRGRAFGGVWQDLRHAWRTLGRDPLVTAIAVLTLTFGIGLNTSMFGLTNALLLRPLPFPEPASLVQLFRTTDETQSGALSPADYLALRQAESAVGRFAAFRPSNLVLTDAGPPAEWLAVSATLFDVLGVQPVRGRAFRAEDEMPGTRRVVVISSALWQDRFAGADDIIGRTMQTSGGPYEIVGVLPPAASDHRLFGRTGLFSPLILDDAARLDRTSHTLAIVGRRGAAVTEAQAGAFVAAMGAQMAADFPAANARTAWRSEPLRVSNTGPTGRALLAMLFGLSACVLLIACSNLANLLLARAIDRTREFAVRAALGASRLQMIRTLVLESCLLAAAGGAGAVLVAMWTTRWLQSIVVDVGGPTIPLDWRVLSFAAAASLSTVLFCGVAPALFTRRIGLNETLKSGGRGTAARGHVRVRNALLVGQFAMALILLAGAAFFLRGTIQMLSQPYGWRADGVVQADLGVPVERYPENRDVTALQQRVLARLQSIPGVASASVSYGLPYLGLRGIAPYVADAAGHPSALTARINGVSPAYFTVTGTRLAAGRVFDDTDTATSSKVAILSESMAQRLFPDGRALGRRVAQAADESREWLEVVGIVADVRSIDLAQEASPFQLYQPTTQDPRRDLLLAVRSADAASERPITALRSAIAELDPDLVPRRLKTAGDSLQEVTASMSLVTRLLIAFALLGLLLAALGIYAAMTRMVAQRTDEIGLRMALGAQGRNVLGLVLFSGARIVMIGMGIGLVGAFALSRLLESVLPSMEMDNAVAGSAATAVLGALALLACYVPARSATHVSPIVALRGE
jgi:predicted permease